MGKNKRKEKASSTTSVKVIGVLADESAIRTLNVANQEMGDAVCAISQDLKKHIDTTFALRGDGLTIDAETVVIPGIVKYDPTDTIVDVAQQLPPESYMVMLYSPIDSQKGLIKNAINQMIVDRSIQEVDRNAPPWPPSTTEDDKLSQILEHIKKLDRNIAQLDRKVNIQDGVITRLKDENSALKADNAAFKAENAAFKADNAAFKADNAALKVRVGILEEDNQVLREAIDGQTAALRKLRRRILLDRARKKILSQWAPNNPRTTWTNLCDAMSESDLRHFISSRNVFARALSDDAFTMVYDGRGTVRLEGNEVAHEADRDLVRDAVVHAAPGDLLALKNIYGCVFDEDLQ